MDKDENGEKSVDNNILYTIALHTFIRIITIYLYKHIFRLLYIYIFITKCYKIMNTNNINLLTNFPTKQNEYAEEQMMFSNNTCITITTFLIHVPFKCPHKRISSLYT